MTQEVAATSFAVLDGKRRKQAAARFAVLRPHLEEGVPLTRAAVQAGVPLRTAERWLARYRQGGLPSLARLTRRDAGTHRSPADIVALVEGMALKRPRSSAASIYRRVGVAAAARDWHAPSYATVRAIIAALSLSSAHGGSVSLKDDTEAFSGVASSEALTSVDVQDLAGDPSAVI